MYQHEGLGRSHRHNQAIAGYLAFVAGWVNSAGFVMIGAFTSHVTGNLGRVADDLSRGWPAAAARAVAIVAAFFAGAFIASMAIESRRRRARVYGALHLAEAALLAVFVGLAAVDAGTHRDVQAMLLSSAMGIQNSLVTRLSGAVVRTTHLTGVVTDLGIESARWFRYWRAQLGVRTSLPLVFGDQVPERPVTAKTVLLATILAAFTSGALGGAGAALAWGHVAFAAPIALLVGGGVAAIVSGWRVPVDDERG